MAPLPRTGAVTNEERLRTPAVSGVVNGEIRIMPPKNMPEAATSEALRLQEARLCRSAI